MSLQRSILYRTNTYKPVCHIKNALIHKRNFAPDDPYLHAKILACGGEAMIGSANFSFDGMTVNHELDVVLQGQAAAKLTAFANQIERADSK